MFSKEKSDPVPTRGSVFKKEYVKGYAKGAAAAAALLVLAACAVYIGVKTAPGIDIPVALADGSVITPPYYITVDGKKTVLVESKEAAETAVQKVIEEYEGDPEDVIDITVEENTGTEKMKIETGDEPPDIMTVEEAKENIQLTVVVTKEETDTEFIDYDEKYTPTSELYIGETEIQTEGEEGIKEVTTKTVTTNGEIVETEIVEENIIKEPVEQVVLKGTKAGGTLTTPVPTVYISSPFGPRWGSFHSGVDFALSQGEPIYAACSGTVCYSGYSGGYGKLIKIDHGSGMQTCYAHCSSLLVSNGQQVEAGETIGLIGSTGNSTGPHLHFEVIINGNRVDPLDFMDLE